MYPLLCPTNTSSISLLQNAHMNTELTYCYNIQYTEKTMHTVPLGNFFHFKLSPILSMNRNIKKNNIQKKLISDNMFLFLIGKMKAMCLLFCFVWFCFVFSNSSDLCQKWAVDMITDHREIGINLWENPKEQIKWSETIFPLDHHQIWF